MSTKFNADHENHDHENTRLMKTVKYEINGPPIVVIQRAGGLVTVNGKELPFAGRTYVDEEIEYLKANNIEYEVYMTDYWTGKRIEIV